ncbi:MAG: methyltransferase domain-containing protein [Nitrospira sp.]
MYEANRLSAVDDGLWNPDFVLHREIANFLPSGHFASVLDYGAGNSPYRERISCDRYVKADVTQNVRGDIDYVIQPGTKLPVPDSTFDLVLLLDVLEHVRDPAFVVGEVRRLLKPNGRAVVSLPFLYREHETPHDFLRLTAFGAQELFKGNGAEVLKIRKVGNAYYALFTLFLERAIVNGERSELGFMGRVVNKCAIALLPILRPALSVPPPENAGVYHHLLLDVAFP